MWFTFQASLDAWEGGTGGRVIPGHTLQPTSTAHTTPLATQQQQQQKVRLMFRLFRVFRNIYVLSSRYQSQHDLTLYKIVVDIHCHAWMHWRQVVVGGPRCCVSPDKKSCRKQGTGYCSLICGKLVILCVYAYTAAIYHKSGLIKFVSRTIWWILSSSGGFYCALFLTVMSVFHGSNNWLLITTVP